MDLRTAQQLIALNREFYDRNHASFSATRSAPWHGWIRLATMLGKRFEPAAGPGPSGQRLRLLDVACGNLRLERFLLERLPHARWELSGVDACEKLPDASVDMSFEQVDLLQELLEGRRPLDGVRAADLVACFGFFHHVPTAELRLALLDELVGAMAPGGLCAVSLWAFARDGRMRLRAEETTERGRAELGLRGLDAGDYLLGWQGRAHAYRYCHSFSEAEVDGMESHLRRRGLDVVRYEDEGGRNVYLVAGGGLSAEGPA